MLDLLPILANVSAPALATVAAPGNQAGTFLAFLNDLNPRDSAVVPASNDAKSDVAVDVPSTGNAIVPKDAPQPQRKERSLALGSPITVPAQIAQALPIPAESAGIESSGTAAITAVSNQEHQKLNSRMIEASGASADLFPFLSRCSIADEPKNASSDIHASKEKARPEPAPAFEFTPPTLQSGNQSPNAGFSFQASHAEDAKLGLKIPAEGPGSEASVQTRFVMGSDQRVERRSSHSLHNQERETGQAASGQAAAALGIWDYQTEKPIKADTDPAQAALSLNQAPKEKSDQNFVSGHQPKKAIAISEGTFSPASPIADRKSDTATDQPLAAVGDQHIAAATIELIHRMPPLPAATPEKPVVAQQRTPDVQSVRADRETHEGRISAAAHSIEPSAKEAFAKAAMPSAKSYEPPSQPGMQHTHQVFASDSEAGSKPSSRAEGHAVESRANIRSREVNRPTDDEVSSTKNEHQIQPAQPVIAQATERPHTATEPPAGRCINPAVSAADASGDTAISSKNDPGHLEHQGNSASTEVGLVSPDAPIHTARMFQSEDRSEMRIGLRTENFGAVQVHTSVSASKVDVALGSERGDLKAFLATELPALRDHLQTRGIHLQESGTPAQTAGGHSGFSSGEHSNQPWRQRTAMARPEFGRDEVSERESTLLQGRSLNVTA